MPQQKTFQASGRYKNLFKSRETISTTEIFPLWPPFFSAKKVPLWSRVHGVFHPISNLPIAVPAQQEPHNRSFESQVAARHAVFLAHSPLNRKADFF